MRVGFLTSRLPHPPHRGDRLTTYQILRALAPRHEASLLSFVDGSEGPGAREALAPLCRRIETVHLSRARSWAQAWMGLAGRTPSQVAYYRSPRMREAVRRWVGEGRFDVVFTQLFRMAPYAAPLDHPAKVLFLADSIGLALRRSAAFQPAWRRPGIAWEARRAERYEAAISTAFTETWVVSPVDRDDLARRGCRNLRVVPHGVDATLAGVGGRSGGPPTVVFLGNLSVPHNVDAARFAAVQVWPIIRRARPDTRFVLAGADPVRALRALHGRDGIEVPGAVPDLVPLWERATVLLAPLRFATGIQNKVLEAMIAEVPVVTTPDVAAGIGDAEGTLLSVAMDAGAMAAESLRILGDTEAHRERSRRARAFVESRFRWENVVSALEEVAQGRTVGPRVGAVH